ncbi:MAG: MurR/RpiR family transcriptional regulator [Tissierellia bacterium]|jgi:DNA-binding MurR/RpiR family transcriptional regulator|nr:MurR/RpiR family transcriptional regulator [Tissierellia bacterium]
MKRNPNTFEIITSNYEKLSKSHQRIADYILQHYDRAVYMTARKIASNLGISESTVVRFATSLGYDGYPSFQEHLRNSSKAVMTTRQKLTQELEPKSKDAALVQSFQRDMLDLKNTSEIVNYPAVKMAASKIVSSHRVFILGKRSSGVLVDYLAYYLNFFHDNVRVFESNVLDFFEQLIHIKKDDLVVMFSFPRYAKNTIEMAQFIKEQGAQIIAITDNVDAPIVEYSTHCLIASYSRESFIDSLVAPMALVNALITSIAYDNLELTENKLDTLETLWQEYDTYI